MKRPEVLEKQLAALRAKNGVPDRMPVRTETDSNIVARIKERHYTVSEIGEMWGISVDKVRDIFENEPGVFDASKNPHGKDRRKRRHRMLLIPESVMVRVYTRRSNPAA